MARVFAYEYTRARLPLYRVPEGGDRVLTPSGACCNLIFLVGALTETEQRGPDRWYGRVADPTGVFEVRADHPDPVQYQAIRQIEPPTFVTVMGEAQFFSGQKNSEPGLFLLQIQESDRMIRDRWILRTAEISYGRLVTLSEVIRSGSGPAGYTEAVCKYNITDKDIREMAGMICQALNSLVQTAEKIPDKERIKEQILTIIRESAGRKGITLSDLVVTAGQSGIGEREVREAVRGLLEEDECYQPAKEVFKAL
jgi:RPA family protein